jgi:flagellar biosynthetic protein FlhB
MAGDNGQNQTEKATPRRRERARQDGDVAYSADLTAAAGLIGLALLVDTGGAHWVAGLGRAIEQMIAGCGVKEWTFNHTTLMARWMGLQLLITAGTAMLAVIALTLVTGGVQSGFRITAKPLNFKWERLSLSQGWSRLMSADTLIRTLSVLLKLVLITTVCAIALQKELGPLRIAGGQRLHVSVAFGAGIMSRVLWATAAGALALGLADIIWQRWRRERRLRMSKTDLKQEQKEDGGDPQIRARIRRLQRDVSKRKGLRDVAGATVVLTNPTHFAVALKYDRDSNGAPRVVAKGSDGLAKLIIRLARKNGVPVLERKPLARALYKFVEVGKEIPSEFYQAVAEILAFLYRHKRSA